MISPQKLAEYYGMNVQIVQDQCEGLTHAQSLLQLPFRGNCLNWVVGHLVAGRHGLLVSAGQRGVLTEEQAARYDYGSEPVTCDGPDVIPLLDLLHLLEVSQERLTAWLQKATPEELAKEIPFAGRTMTLGEKAFFLYFHDSYHTGQTEILRQLAGTNDAVI